MKNALLLFLGVIIFTLGGLLLRPSGTPGTSATDTAASPCNAPLTYRFGAIDSRYSISKTELKQVMDQVNNLWSDVVGRDLLKYKSDGEVVINLIYSNEQQFTENEQQLSKRIDQGKQRYSSLKEKYNRFKREYEVQLSSYNQTISRYKQAVDQFNVLIAELNSKGTVTKEEKQKMQEKKSQIDHLKSILREKQDKLNVSRNEVNRVSEQLNSLADQQNALIYHYNDRYSDQKKFDQGNYIQAGGEKKINIYQFTNLDNLKLVLAHEVGHALGLSHVENPRSIMYYLMKEQDEANLELSREDIKAIQSACGL